VVIKTCLNPAIIWYTTKPNPPPPPPPPPQPHTVCTYILYIYFGKGGRGVEVREKVEGPQYTSLVLSSMGTREQQFTSWVENKNHE
jgi:hypothetical protein